MSAKVVQLTQGRKQRNATSSKGRQGNEAYRVREHLTEAEIERLLAALKQNRYGHRDWLIGLLIYRHGLRVIKDDATADELRAEIIKRLTALSEAGVLDLTAVPVPEDGIGNRAVAGIDQSSMNGK
jgi:hypothetical protein